MGQTFMGMQRMEMHQRALVVHAQVLWWGNLPEALRLVYQCTQRSSAPDGFMATRTLAMA